MATRNIDTIKGPLKFDNTVTTNAGLSLRSLTTTQRDALTPTAGMLIHNSTIGQVEEYNGSTWAAVLSQKATIYQYAPGLDADTTLADSRTIFPDGSAYIYRRLPSVRPGDPNLGDWIESVSVTANSGSTSPDVVLTQGWNAYNSTVLDPTKPAMWRAREHYYNFSSFGIMEDHVAVHRFPTLSGNWNGERRAISVASYETTGHGAYGGAVEIGCDTDSLYLAMGGNVPYAGVSHGNYFYCYHEGSGVIRQGWAAQMATNPPTVYLRLSSGAVAFAADQPMTISSGGTLTIGIGQNVAIGNNLTGGTATTGFTIAAGNVTWTGTIPSAQLGNAALLAADNTFVSSVGQTITSSSESPIRPRLTFTNTANSKTCYIGTESSYGSFQVVTSGGGTYTFGDGNSPMINISTRTNSGLTLGGINVLISDGGYGNTTLSLCYDTTYTRVYILPNPSTGHLMFEVNRASGTFIAAPATNQAGLIVKSYIGTQTETLMYMQQWDGSAYLSTARLDAPLLNATPTGRFRLDVRYSGTWQEAIRVDANSGGAANIALFGAGSWGGGVGTVFIANATTVPSTNPAGGGVLYVDSGALKYRGSSGTVTTIGAP